MPAPEHVLASYTIPGSGRRIVSRTERAGTVRLLDFPDPGKPRDRIYLIEPSLPGDEVEAVVTDYLGQAQTLNRCPMDRDSQDD